MSVRLRHLQRAVHAAARDIGLEPEDRRALQIVATGKSSTAEMDEAELARVMDALRARGWRPAAGRARPRSERADIRFIHVLWRLLAEAGHVERGRPALNRFLRARFAGVLGAAVLDVDMLRDGATIAVATEALKAMCDRHGIVLEPRRGPR